MCYYNGQRITKAEYLRLLKLEKEVAEYGFLKDDLKAGPDYGLSAVLRPIPGAQPDFELVEMEWGFLPSYIQSFPDALRMRRGYTDNAGVFQKPIVTLNARGEELINQKKIFREAGLARRCLVLSTGYYEWKHIYPINKRTGLPVKTAKKYPYRIGVKDKEYFYLAGIWQPWKDKDNGREVDTFTILTTSPNALAEQVHPRMPVILDDERAYSWMFGTLSEAEIRELATYQFPAELMYAYTIDKDFRSAAEPTAPFDYPELPPLHLTA